jgi:hypothetical protein
VSVLLAELQIWHTRPAAPTRRLALGHLVLPTDPAPGLGGVLLAAVVAAYRPGVPEELWPDVERLIDQVVAGDRIVQPRLQHRYQIDRHGFATSVHQMHGDADHVEFDLHSGRRSPRCCVVALGTAERRVEARSLLPCMKWRGPIGPSSRRHRGVSRRPAGTDPRCGRSTCWAPPHGVRRRTMARTHSPAAHPDHGGDDDAGGSSTREARRILLSHDRAPAVPRAGSSAVSSLSRRGGGAPLRAPIHVSQGRRKVPDPCACCWRRRGAALAPEPLILGGADGGRTLARRRRRWRRCRRWDGAVPYLLHLPGKPDKLRAEHFLACNCRACSFRHEDTFTPEELLR